MKSQLQPKKSLSIRYLTCTLIHLQGTAERQGGYTLVITVAMLLILSVLLVTYAVTSKVDNVSSMSSAKSNTGFYTAEAGLNLRAKQIRNRFEGYNRPSGTSPASWQNCLDSNPSNDGTGDFACHTESDLQTANTDDAFKNQISAQNATTFITENSENPFQIVIPKGETFGGLSAQEYRYNVVSVARDNQSRPTAILKMQLKSQLIPLFQFAAFYQQDMDFNIPLTMTLNGPVHSNNDLYLDAAGGNTLGITGQVTMAGKLYRGSKYENRCSGTVNVQNPIRPTPLSCRGTRGQFPTAALRGWNGQIQQGLRPLTVPEPDSFEAKAGINQTYWNNADLRIALDLSTKSIEVVNADGIRNPTTDQLDTACVASRTQITTAVTAGTSIVTVNDPSIFAVGKFVTLGSDPTATPYVVESISGSDITLNRGVTTDIAANTSIQTPVVSFSDKTFRNYREKRSAGGGRNDNTPIKMLNVDVRGLLNCSETLMNGRLVDDEINGGRVWFLTVKGDNSETINDYGVRLYNGRDFTTPVNGHTLKGLSVISDQAVYVQGDYNCGSISPCKKDDPDDERLPAAIMADSLNVLSNAWPLDDSWSNRDIISRYNPGAKGRPAEDTTINAAFLSGIDITGGTNRGGQDGGLGTSGGGLNNFPRFHEDWSDRAISPSSVTFTYQGSMVSLGTSKKVNGAFCGSGSMADCNIYNPPIRNWRYDPRFDDAANLPPMTPRVVYLKQENFTRDFGALSQRQPLWWIGQVPTFLGSLTHIWQRFS